MIDIVKLIKKIRHEVKKSEHKDMRELLIFELLLVTAFAVMMIIQYIYKAEVWMLCCLMRWGLLIAGCIAWYSFNKAHKNSNI